MVSAFLLLVIVASLVTGLLQRIVRLLQGLLCQFLYERDIACI